MSQEPSPEEILLRLIKEGKSKGQNPAPPPSEDSARSETPAADAPGQAWPAATSGLGPVSVRKISQPLWQKAKAWGFRSQNLYCRLYLVPRLLLLACATLVILIVFHTVYDRIGAKQQIKKIWTGGSKPLPGESELADALSPQPLSATLPNKELFKFLDFPGAPGPTAAPAARIASLDQILANYTLSGIIGGDPPQAVIEDKRQGKTYFVGVGDSLGELRIVSIEEGKVIVAVGNEQAQLDL